MPSIAIIGGGLSGLTAAYRLQQRGARVTVFESGDRVGGRMVTDVIDGFRVDAGAQLFGSMYERFFALVREIGLGDRLVRVPGRDALWRDGRPHEVVYGSVTSMIASGGLPLRTKLRLGSTYVPFLSRHSDDLDLHAPERAALAGLDAESIAEWGRREIDEAFVTSLVYPQLGAYYGTRPEDASAGFYHILARYGMDVKLYAVKGGAGAVPQRLAELISAAGEVRTGTETTAIDIGEESVTVEASGRSEVFDGVLAAVPAPVLLRITRNLKPPLQEWLQSVHYHPTLSLALLLDRPLGPRYFGLSFPQGTMQYLAALALQENKGVDLVPAGHGLLVAIPTPETVGDLIGLESREVLERMLPEIEQIFNGVRRHVKRARVYRWPVGTPRMYPGYLRHLGAFRSSAPEGDERLAVAGDYLFGPSVEGAVSSAATAVQRLHSRLA